MRKIYVIYFMWICCIHVFGYETIKNGISWVEDSLRYSIVILDDNVARVQVYPVFQDVKRSLVLNDSTFAFSDFESKETKKGYWLQTRNLKIQYDFQTKRISFVDKKTGSVILSENSRAFMPIDVLGEKAYSVKQGFKLTNDEAIYGLGQYQDGALNYRGKQVKLVHANREIANPVLLSSRKYLIYWDNYSKTLFSDTPEEAVFHSEVGDGISYCFVYGDSMKEVMDHYWHLTGTPPLLPKSAYGFWVSKERYKTFEELTGVVAEYRKRNIPIDNIVQDWQYWGNDMGLWNSMEFDSVNYANPKEVIDKLHKEYNVKLALSVWPGVGKKTSIYKAMDSLGLLFDVPTWAGYKVVDIYNPTAQKIYWDFLFKGLYSKGVDSWWMDATEPSFRDGLYQDKQEEWSKKAGRTYIGPFHRYLNTYSLFLSKNMYDNLRNVSDKRVSILTRSAFAGQQKYSTITWSGDIYASWDVYKKQIPAGLNMCMTGIPYWTTDIGGFRVRSQDKIDGGASGEISGYQVENKKAVADGGYRNGLKDPAYLELYTRWFQYGTFNPIFRIHGTEIPREIWHFGEPGEPYYEAQKEMILLRYSLLSYIYSNAWKVTTEGASIMKALVMDFADDKKVYDDATSFMFGDALLVHPVTRPMYYDRNGKIEHLNTLVSIYLPKHNGRYWFDFHSQRVYDAGASVDYDAPLDVLPLFVKAGSIIPRNKLAQYATADDNREMDIEVYTGADARFSLYEDDSETYAYEKGHYNEIQITWNEKLKKIQISKIEGNKESLLDERIFNFKIISRNEKNERSVQVKKVVYKNKPVSFKVK